eukprot:SAG22_NODE_7940_length_696_cov_1.125628_2_plen_116_part_00
MPHSITHELGQRLDVVGQPEVVGELGDDRVQPGRLVSPGRVVALVVPPRAADSVRRRHVGPQPLQLGDQLGLGLVAQPPGRRLVAERLDLQCSAETRTATGVPQLPVSKRYSLLE